MPDSASQKMPASCLILAGGEGRRLSPDKPLLLIEGEPIIQRIASLTVKLFAEVVVVTNTPEKYAFLGLPLVPDQRRGCGPLMGIYSGLCTISQEVAFVCAADMPFLDATLIRRQFREMDGYDIVVPSPRGRTEFLHTFYRRGCLPAIRQTLDAGVYRIEPLTRHCRTLRLELEWFQRQGLTPLLEKAFANINTAQDYRHWQDGDCCPPEPPGSTQASERRPAAGCKTLQALSPAVLQAIRQTLIEQETAYQSGSGQESMSSLWAHSSRAGRIAHHIAQSEGWEPEPALLAGLLHDTGKFAHGGYHQDDIPEEQHALEFVERILKGSAHERWIPQVSQAILTMYLEAKATSDIGKAAHDADNLDKLGCLGVAQFFAKNALRRRFLDDDLLCRASIELTYAHHAPEMLKTPTGQALARQRAARTRQFYEQLLEEWSQLGLGDFRIIEEDIGGIVCILIVPRACDCGAGLEIATDIRDALKCRSVLVSYACQDCGQRSQYSFCLPNLPGLPPKV